MAFPSTYSDGDFVILDFKYPYKSIWLDGRSSARSDSSFSFKEYDRYRQLAGKTLNTRGNAFTSSTIGLQAGYVPVIAKSATFSFDVAASENGIQVSRSRIGLTIQFYDTQLQAGVGPLRVFATPTVALMGSLAKKTDKVALSKAQNLHSVFIRAFNDNGITISAGTAVRYNGITGDGVVEVEVTDGNQADNNFVGIVQEDIPTGVTGCCSSAVGPGAWVPNATISAPNDGGLLYLNGSTGGISHTPGGGSQVIGRLLHEGTSGGAHYISFMND
jgi:hypothetical protein